MVCGVRDGYVGGGVLVVVGNRGSGLSCGIVGAYSFWSWLLQVAAMPSVGAQRRNGLVLWLRRKSVLDRTMARLILVQMKLAMSKYVWLHFFMSSQVMHR